MDQELVPVYPLLQVYTKSDALATLSKSIFTGLSQCLLSGTMLTLISNIGKAAGLDISIPNINTQVEEVLLSIDLDDLIGDLNLSVNLPSSFDQISNTTKSFNASSLNLASVQSMNFTSTLSNSLSSIKTKLQTLSTTVTTSSFTYSVGATGPQQTAAVNEFKTLISSIITSIDALNTGTLQQMSTSLTTAKSTASSLSTLMLATSSRLSVLDASKTYLSTSMELYLNQTKTSIVNGTIPAVFNDIRSFASGASDALSTVAKCKSFAYGFYAVQGAVCVRAQDGFDTLFWSFAYLAFFFSIAMYHMALTGGAYMMKNSVSTRKKKHNRGK
jgi:hypothetical protein